MLVSECRVKKPKRFTHKTIPFNNTQNPEFVNNRPFIPEGQKMLIVVLKPYVIVFCN